MTLRARNRTLEFYEFTKELERTSDARFKGWKWPHQNQSILLTTALVAKNEQQKKLHAHAPTTSVN